MCEPLVNMNDELKKFIEAMNNIDEFWWKYAQGIVKDAAEKEDELWMDEATKALIARLRKQRDRLLEVLKSIHEALDGHVVCAEGTCMDCDFLRSVARTAIAEAEDG